ncbi:hypothetical protein BGZ60DRAFT_548855 [Tricladium varicosporioides]|nr:hypothetical protein BGZ60DRAFT_548855 [Hymenoscyphus varicosporioides]
MPLPLRYCLCRFTYVYIFLSLSTVTATHSLFPQHSLNPSLVLSTYQTCSENGAGDLTASFSYGSSELFVANTGVPYFYPWSYDPVCTPFIPGFGSELCVYTKYTFSDKRGISIFTTPAIAEKFAALPPFQVDLVLDGINDPASSWRIQKMHTKGFGVVASQNLDWKDKIMSTTPLLLVHPPPSALSSESVEIFLRIAIEQLPVASRDWYLGLATIFGIENLKVQDVLKANTFEVQVGGVMHLAVFPEQSRINHDCGPNAQYYIDHDNLSHHVHAVREIAEGEEVTISCIADIYFSDTNPFQRSSTRKGYLQDAFSFTCTCLRCTSSKESDRNLKRLSILERSLSYWDHKPQTKDVMAETKVAEKLVASYLVQKLHGFMDRAYYFAAMAYVAVGEREIAISYAQLAMDAKIMTYGPRTDVQVLEDIIRNPEKHPRWRKRYLERGR